MLWQTCILSVYSDVQFVHICIALLVMMADGYLEFFLFISGDTV